MVSDTPRQLPFTRRSFLKKTAAAGAAASSMPFFIHAQDKAAAKAPVLGAGEFKYECIHDWGNLPKGHHYGGASHGVCIDEKGSIYIKHQGKPAAIFVFDPDGNFLRAFGKEYLGGGHGIDVRKEGGQEFLYLSDIRNRIIAKSTLTGEQVWKKSFPEESGKYKNIRQFRPTNISFTPDGGFHVGDGYGSHYIHQYDKDANYVRTFGGPGKGPGQLRTPHGQWLDDRDGTPKLVVADRANARLQYFTLDGKHLSFVTGLSFPADIDIQGDIMLVPDLHARVTLFDKDNKVIIHLGDDPEWTKEVKKFKIRGDRKLWKPGKFIHPHDGCFDKDGNIFIVEWVRTGRITKLRKVT